MGIMMLERVLNPKLSKKIMQNDEHDRLRDQTMAR
jgi:hypothetical protein